MYRTTRVPDGPAAGVHRGRSAVSSVDYDVPFIPAVMVIPPGTLLPGGDPPTAPRP
jgi:hypothetical protein